MPINIGIRGKSRFYVFTGQRTNRVYELLLFRIERIRLNENNKKTCADSRNCLSINVLIKSSNKILIKVPKYSDEKI